MLLHGRSADKLQNVEKSLAALGGNAIIETWRADLSSLRETSKLAEQIAAKHQRLDVLVNNAGVLKTPKTTTADGLDVRFAVNAISPYLLTTKLLPLLGSTGRVINVSSAAQAPVRIPAMKSAKPMADMDAYSQSKLALTMWSRVLAAKQGSPTVIAVNPGSLLGSKVGRPVMSSLCVFAISCFRLCADFESDPHLRFYRWSKRALAWRAATSA